MAYIELPEGIPGIVGPLMNYPETAKPLNELADALLRATTSLTPAERELIAAYTSYLNECKFCFRSHAAVARVHFAENRTVVDDVIRDVGTAPISERMKALLMLAAKVQRGGQHVMPEDVAQARVAGADDRAIHDTVLIAAAFCMFNRYVDGLATFTPEAPEAYEGIAQMLASQGYAASVPPR